jgi:putative addiction module component (TIGR02574 family)
MSDAARKLTNDALQLSDDERAELAVTLIRSLDGKLEADVEAAWGEEIEKRARDALAGKSRTESWDAVRERARARIQQR